MSTPQMQPEPQNKPGKTGRHGQPHAEAAKRRRLDGDPAQQVTASLSWVTGGVTATFPATEAPSSGTWDSTAMTVRSTTVLVGTGRLTSNSMSVVVRGSTYSNASVSDGSATVVLTLVT